MYEGYEEERRLVPFLVSFFVTLLIMSGVLYWLVLFIGARGGTAPTAKDIAAHDTIYLPQREERLTILLTLAENADTPPDVFLLAGFLPDKGMMTVCMLPPKTLITTDDRWGTLAELCEQGGTAYAAKALGGYLGIDIARSGSMDMTALKGLMEAVGFFEYELTATLDYPLHRRQVAMSPGKRLLDGRAIMDILAYPAYKGGEAERSDRGAMLITQMLNFHLPACLTAQGETLCKCFLNHCSTDLSYKDCEERKASAQFLAALAMPAATAVYIEGALSYDYSTFLLSESCRARLHSVYSGDGFGVGGDGTRRDARLGAYEYVAEEKE
ncbi:MAG: hypothetical protein RRY54_03805 [Angelakisella sp.]